MQFCDAVTVEGKPRRIADGYLVATAKCVRTGIQLYTGDELGKPEMKVVRVYRPASEVFAQDSLQSFSHAPIVVGHPKDGVVNSDNVKELGVGEVSTAARPVGDWLELPLIFKDAAAVQKIESGELRELSAGYVADFDFTAGVTPSGEPYDAVQRSIRINHLALVDKARAGSQARVGDSAKPWGAAPITHEETPMTTRTVVVDGISILTTDQGAEVITKLQGQITKLIGDAATATSTHALALAAKDTDIGALKADLKKAQDAANIDVSKLVADRVSLEGQVRAIDSSIDPAGKSDDDLRKATVAAKLGDEMVKDAAPAEIAGMFKALTKDAKPNDSVRDALRTQDHSIVANDAWGANVFASAGVDLKKGA
jgi:hypothetical protein